VVPSAAKRVRAGVARAKRNGTKSGQPIGRPKLDAKREAAVRRSLQAGNGILKQPGRWELERERWRGSQMNCVPDVEAGANVPLYRPCSER